MKATNQYTVNTTTINKFKSPAGKRVEIFFFSLLFFAFILSFRSYSNNSPIIRLKASSVSRPQASDETAIYFDSLATAGFDSAKDAYKLMNSTPGVPNLYSVVNHNFRLSINALPIFWNRVTIISIGLEVDASTQYQIEASMINNFPEDVQIYLVDSVNNKVQDLRANPLCTFYCTTGFSESRFYLRIGAGRTVTGISDKKHENKIKIYSNNNELNIVNDNNPDMFKVNLFDINGQLIMNSELPAYSKRKFYINKGLYIIRFTSANSGFSKKILIE